MLGLRSVVGAGLSAALLAACGGTSALSPTAPALPDAPHTLAKSRTYSFTGKEQRFIVPDGVTRVVITASGASGATCGGSPSGCDGFGGSGNGGLVKAAIAVTAGETLHVYVGGQNGFNGGGAAASSPSSYTANGGGATDVRQGGRSVKDRVVVAGGGGGGGFGIYSSSGGFGGAGGAGGGKVGAAGAGGGSGGGGGGGSQRAGGAAGSGGPCQFYCGFRPRRDQAPQCRECGGGSGVGGGAGALFHGGIAGVGGGGPGGGGGGGWYGGGGGGSGAWSYYGPSFTDGAGGGGGGGSSFIEKGATVLKNVRGGAAPGNGQIVISW